MGTNVEIVNASALKTLKIGHNENSRLDIGAVLANAPVLESFVADEGRVSNLGVVDQCPETLQTIILSFNLLDDDVTEDFSQCEGLQVLRVNEKSNLKFNRLKEPILEENMNVLEVDIDENQMPANTSI